MDHMKRILNELEAQDALEILSLYYQLIMGSTKDEYLAVRDQAVERLESDSLIDPIEHILKTIAFQAQQNMLLMRCAEKYAHDNKVGKFKPIDIEPTHWKVALIDEEREPYSVTLRRDLSDESGGQPHVIFEGGSAPVQIFADWSEPYYYEHIDHML